MEFKWKVLGDEKYGDKVFLGRYWSNISIMVDSSAKLKISGEL